MTSGSLDDLHAQLREFASHVPQILRRTAITQQFARDVESSLAVAVAPFTLAVVGQMRVGKSTLINALVQSELALAGVNETTATVNWFRHGSEAQSGKFRVVWNDAAESSEEHDLSERERWAGSSELAARTRFLEFFSTAEFLKRVHIVDTPGTRSTIGAHERITREFLHVAGRAESDSQYYGGIADCILYVLPPVARENDDQLLSQFTSQNRFSRSTPFNSVAVLHKWEAIDHPRPWDEAIKHARRAFDSLKSCVCDVIPVSGPLARVCQMAHSEFWENVAALVRGSTEEALETLTMQESWFTRPESNCNVSVDRRTQIREQSQLPWPCFKTLLYFAASRRDSSGSALRLAVRELSGVDRLLDFLERRFFSRSRLIRALNVLNRALHLTDLSRAHLRALISDLDAEEEGGRRALEELSSGPAFFASRQFIEQRLVEVQRELVQANHVLQDLERQAGPVQDNFQLFSKDCNSVQCLDEHSDQFKGEEIVEILSVLGAYGSDRTNQSGGDANGEPIDLLHDRLDRWLIERHRATGMRRRILDHVVTRVEGTLRELIRAEMTGSNRQVGNGNGRD